MIPTAKRIAPDELENLHVKLPRDRELVLYCTCPNEATSARAALRLHRRGLGNVRPLHGGFEKWNEFEFPIDESGSSELVNNLPQTA